MKKLRNLMNIQYGWILSLDEIIFRWYLYGWKLIQIIKNHTK